MTEKKKRVYITPDGTKLILEWALEYPRLPRTEVAEKLLEAFGAEPGKYSLWGPPAIEVLERTISHHRQHSMGPEDKPWSLVALSEHDIQPEYLPLALLAWEKALQNKSPLTIRQLKWVIRLSHVLGFSTLDVYAEVELQALINTAKSLSSLEKYVEVEFKGQYPDKPNKEMEYLWLHHTMLYYKDPQQVADLVITIRQITRPKGVTYSGPPDADTIAKARAELTAKRLGKQKEGKNER
jgi:hypothetical protein